MAPQRQGSRDPSPRTQVASRVRCSVFGSPPLRSFHHCPVPAFPLTHSPEGGSQWCRITRGVPTPRLLGVSGRWCCFGSHTLPSRTVALLTQSYPAELGGNSLTTWGDSRTSTTIFSAGGALDGEELLPIELLRVRATPAGALDPEEFFFFRIGAPDGMLECNSATFATSSFGKSWKSFL